MINVTTSTIVAEPEVRSDLDARLDAAFGPADDFTRELTRRGLAAHAATQVLNPGDFDRLVIGTGAYGR